VVLTSMEMQQPQVAVNTPLTGGLQRISRPQHAQTIRSSLIRKSVKLFSKHLQANPEMVPPDHSSRSLPFDSEDGLTAGAADTSLLITTLYGEHRFKVQHTTAIACSISSMEDVIYHLQRIIAIQF